MQRQGGHPYTFKAFKCPWGSGAGLKTIFIRLALPLGYVFSLFAVSLSALDFSLNGGHPVNLEAQVPHYR